VNFLAGIFVYGLGNSLVFAFTVKIKPSKAINNVLLLGWVQKP